MGAWVVVQCAAMAYSRGANGAAPASRYLDMVALGYLANTAAILSWLTPAQRPPLMAPRAPSALVAWISVTGIGIKQGEQGDGRDAWPAAPPVDARAYEERAAVRHDRRCAAIPRDEGPTGVPYYSAPMLASWLEHPYIRRILPAAVRRPLDVRPGRRVGRWRSAGHIAAGGATRSPCSIRTRAGGAAEARFESQPVSCRDFRHAQFEIASSASWSGLQLSLQSVESGQETRVGPPWFDARGWASVAVPCPEGPFRVIAVDSSPTSWFAFRQPAEVALGSALAGSLIQQSRFIGFTAIVLVVVGAGIDDSRLAVATANARTGASDTERRRQMMAADSPLLADGVSVACAVCGGYRDRPAGTSSPATRSADAGAVG